MKRVATFLSGALVGAFGIYVYLNFGSHEPVTAFAGNSTMVVPALARMPIAASADPQASAIETPLSEPPAARPLAPTAAAVTVSDVAALPLASQLLIPVAGIHASALIDTYNEARGLERHHEAIDIPAPTGTQVFAVADGTIAKLFNSKPGGLTVYQFDTSATFAYYYAHLDRYAADIKEGMSLKRGDLVGYVGTSGNADPGTPHLHFAMFALGPEKQWWKGSPINPYPLLGGTTHP